MSVRNNKVPRPKRGLYVPPGQPTIDWSNPITNGLVYAGVVTGADGKNTITDLVSGGVATASLTTSKILAGPAGMMAQQSSSVGGWLQPLTTAQMVQGEKVSWLWMGQNQAAYTSTTASRVFGATYGNGGTTPFMGYGYQRISGTIAQISHGNWQIGATGPTASGSFTTTGSNLIVVSVAMDVTGNAGASTLPTLIDSKSNTWTQAVQVGTNRSSTIFYSINPVTGTGHTFTVGGIQGGVTQNSNLFACATMSCYSGASGGLGTTNSNQTFSSTTTTTGSVTPAFNGSLFITCLAYDHVTQTPSINDSLTVDDRIAYLAGTNTGIASAHLIQTTAGALNPTWTNAASTTDMVATIATFYPDLSDWQIAYNNGTTAEDIYVTYLTTTVGKVYSLCTTLDTNAGVAKTFSNGNLIQTNTGLATGIPSYGPVSLQVTTSAANDTVTTVQPGSITPAASNYLLITLNSFCGGASGTTAYGTVNDSFIAYQPFASIFAVGVGGVAAYLIDGNTSAINPTWTVPGVSTASVQDNVAMMMCFKIANAQFLNSVGFQTGASPTTSSAIDTIGATLLVFSASNYTPGQSFMDISDSAGNTWTQVAGASGSSTNQWIFYCISPITSAAHTFSVTSGSNYASIQVGAFSGTLAQMTMGAIASEDTADSNTAGMIGYVWDRVLEPYEAAIISADPTSILSFPQDLLYQQLVHGNATFSIFLDYLAACAEYAAGRIDGVLPTTELSTVRLDNNAPTERHGLFQKDSAFALEKLSAIQFNYGFPINEYATAASDKLMPVTLYTAAASAIALVSHTNFIAPNGPPITLITHGNWTPDSTSGVFNTTGADLIVLTVATAGYFPALATISDSYGNTWTQGPSTNPEDFSTSTIYYCVNPTVGTSHTFTTSNGFAHPSAQMSAWANAASEAGPSNNNVGGTSQTVQAGSVTPSSNGALIITQCAYDVSGEAPTINGGYSVLDNNDYAYNPGTGFGGWGGTDAYLIQGSAGATNPTWTLTDATSTPAATIAVFYNSSTSSGTSSTINTTDATLLCVSVSQYTSVSSARPVVTDSKGNTWFAIAGAVGTDMQQWLFYAENAIVGTNHTFTVTSIGGYTAQQVTAWSGVLTTGSPLDRTSVSANRFGDTTAQPGSITPGFNNELVISLNSYGNITNAVPASTVNGSFTITDSQASGGGSAIEFITSTSFTTAASPTTSSAINTTGATLLVFTVANYVATNPTVSISDSAGNSWTLVSVGGGSDASANVYYVEAPITSAAHTFSITSSNNYAGCQVAAFSGTATSGVLQASTTAEDYATTSIQAGSITPDGAGYLFIAFNAYGGSETEAAGTIDSGFTMYDPEAAVFPVNVGATAAYLIDSGTSPVNPTWSVPANTTDILAVLCCFKPGSGGAGQSVGGATAYSIQTTATAVNPTWTNNSNGFDMLAMIASFRQQANAVVIFVNYSTAMEILQNAALFPSIALPTGIFGAVHRDIATPVEQLGTGVAYYVSAVNGSDSYNGLYPAYTGTGINGPWATIAHANLGSSYAGGGLSQSQSLLFNGGSTYTGTLVLRKGVNVASFSSTHPIVVGSYGTGNATIVPATGTVSYPNSYPKASGIALYAVELDGVSGITLTNLTVSANGQNCQSGIVIQNTVTTGGISNINVTDCLVEGFGTSLTGATNNQALSEIYICGGGHTVDNSFTGYAVTNVNILNCVLQGVNGVTSNDQTGVSAQGVISPNDGGYNNCSSALTDVTVSGCSIFNIGGIAGTASGSGVVLAQVQNSTIEYCLAHDCSANNTQCGGAAGLWFYDSIGCTIQYCESYNIQPWPIFVSGCDWEGFNLDGGCYNCTIQYVYSHHNFGPGFLGYVDTGAAGGNPTGSWNNNTYRYNISVNDAYGCGDTTLGVINFGGAIQPSPCNVYVYNNTIINTSP